MLEEEEEEEEGEAEETEEAEWAEEPEEAAAPADDETMGLMAAPMNLGIWLASQIARRLAGLEWEPLVFFGINAILDPAIEIGPMSVTHDCLDERIEEGGNPLGHIST